MKYPTEREIQEYMAAVPAEIKDQFRGLIEDSQREFRRSRLQDPSNEKALIQILYRHAAVVFKTLVAKRLKVRPADPDEFRRQIGFDGGDAEMAMWFSHEVYRLSGDGRMLKSWALQIHTDLWDLIREAENIYWLPERVPATWEPFIQAGAPEIGPRPASEPAREAPSSFFEAYRAKHPGVTYDLLASRIGISRDSLFNIKDEKARVRDYAYAAAAVELGCDPANLQPRNLPKVPRRSPKKQR